ncbi:IS21-like element helper ATPase IstB [Castellaniella sp.]|uniref:IS21-like element helper ATPase IstB n=1 Tax=Castellaniella sp. TaxID=1955812 RepID=UPI002AFE776A|nr:IS21-like element helper ATPase IstB [Castellaniella sp.]
MSALEIARTQYRALRLNAIGHNLVDLVARAEAGELSYLDFAHLLAEHELAERASTRIERHRRASGLPTGKYLEGFDYRHQTTISKRQVNTLLDFSFIDNRENIIFIGPPGVGKTHLAIGIGHKAVASGYKVLFRTALDLVEDLELAEMKGELKKRINQLAKFDLLVIDELGYLPMTPQARFNLFQLVNTLYEYRSIILTTNKGFADWGAFFHHDNVAIPIIDRIIHHSNVFMLGGESYRLRQKMPE